MTRTKDPEKTIVFKGDDLSRWDWEDADTLDLSDIEDELKSSINKATRVLVEKNGNLIIKELLDDMAGILCGSSNGDRDGDGFYFNVYGLDVEGYEVNFDLSIMLADMLSDDDESLSGKRFVTRLRDELNRLLELPET